MKTETLIHCYLIGEATPDEVAERDRQLAADPELRRAFVFEAGTDAGLREITLERNAEPSSADQKIISPLFRPAAWIAAAAAIMLFDNIAITMSSNLSSARTLKNLPHGHRGRRRLIQTRSPPRHAGHQDNPL